MAAADPRQHLLSLVRDFAQERSQGERRVSGLRKRAAELAPALESAVDGLEAAKRSKEMAEQELRAAEVELSLSDAAVVAHESRILLLQDEISKIGSEISLLKNEDDKERNEFIDKMNEFNKEIRKFYDTTRKMPSKQIEGTAGDLMPDIEEESKKLEKEIFLVHDQNHTLELGCLEEQDTYDQVVLEISSLEERVLLVESMGKDMKELQELAGQIAESEKQFTEAVEELRRRHICPRCQKDNMAETDDAMAAD